MRGKFNLGGLIVMGLWLGFLGWLAWLAIQALNNGHVVTGWGILFLVGLGMTMFRVGEEK